MTLNMIYSLSFLALFAITVFVTLMGAAKIRPFHNMPDKVVKILVVDEGPLHVIIEVDVTYQVLLDVVAADGVPCNTGQRCV